MQVDMVVKRSGLTLMQFNAAPKVPAVEVGSATPSDNLVGRPDRACRTRIAMAFVKSPMSPPMPIPQPAMPCIAPFRMLDVPPPAGSLLVVPVQRLPSGLVVQF